MGRFGGRPDVRDAASGIRTYDAIVQGEDTPELTWVDGLVIGLVCLASGNAFVLGVGSIATAVVTLDKPYSLELLGTSLGAVVSATLGSGVYFLSGGPESATRGHRMFAAILHWSTAAGILGAGLALAGVAIRAAFGFN